MDREPSKRDTSWTKASSTRKPGDRKEAWSELTSSKDEGEDEHLEKMLIKVISMESEHALTLLKQAEMALNPENWIYDFEMGTTKVCSTPKKDENKHSDKMEQGKEMGDVHLRAKNTDMVSDGKRNEVKEAWTTCSVGSSSISDRAPEPLSSGAITAAALWSYIRKIRANHVTPWMEDHSSGTIPEIPRPRTRARSSLEQWISNKWKMSKGSVNRGTSAQTPITVVANEADDIVESWDVSKTEETTEHSVGEAKRQSEVEGKKHGRKTKWWNRILSVLPCFCGRSGKK